SLVLPQSAMRQLTSYLRGTAFEVGLLLHFGEEAKFYRRIMFNENKKQIRPLSVSDPLDPGPEGLELEEIANLSDGRLV
ncbi:MAG: hypothetical protein ACRD3J_14795, partial [Thermoanaerobaculia bacterium]